MRNIDYEYAYEDGYNAAKKDFETTPHKFNINDCIKVKLTAKGKKIIQEDYEQLCASYPNLDIKMRYVEDADGYTEFQLWDFMRLFGSHLYCGSPCYIEKNQIILEELEWSQ